MIWVGLFTSEFSYLLGISLSSFVTTRILLVAGICRHLLDTHGRNGHMEISDPQRPTTADSKRDHRHVPASARQSAAPLTSTASMVIDTTTPTPLHFHLSPPPRQPQDTNSLAATQLQPDCR
jgi:hypothetical protein